ncbi:MAG: acetate--CoA ligase [Prolixibacteraceae bacterium]
MDLNFIQEKNTLICRFSGRLTTEISSTLAEELASRIEEVRNEDASKEPFRIIFDLDDVIYLSSSFLRVCMIAAKKVEKNLFSIVNTNQFVKDLLLTAGMENIAIIELKKQAEQVFEPSKDFVDGAHINSFEAYKALYKSSIDNNEEFWSEQAKSHIEWFKPFTKTLEWNLPYAKWFTGGKLNACYNCVDKHLKTDFANKAALIWEGEPASPGKCGEERTLTYKQLFYEVSRFANVLKRNGVKKGDRVIIYMPMTPEAVIAMLASSRIGAIHSVIFGGFSAQSIAERIYDCQAKIVITSDGGYRRGTLVPLKKNVDDALKFRNEQGELIASIVEKVIIHQRAFNDISIIENRDLWWHQELEHVDNECLPESLDSEDGLFILYTSGSTGKPKGIYHTIAGFLLETKLSFKYIFDIKNTDIFWCTADIGWITGHSYVVYGPLANGATVMLYEGAPDFPEPDRFWKIIEKYGVTIFYTAPTAIRAFMKWGEKWVKKHNLDSLRLLGSVGEPINPEAWLWFYEMIGNKKCPIVDTWWQTETGAIMISPFPGATPTKPGAASFPFFGIAAEIVDDLGKALPDNELGNLIIRKPWPSMLRGIWGDNERYKEVYWSDIPGSYFTGDGARRDKDGYFWILGRLDDVINISGHRIGTAEIESALVGHSSVAEAAAVGRPDDLKGSALVVFVTLKSGTPPTNDLREELKKQVVREIGAVAKPDEIRFTEVLPKTRSGKIMRRLLKQLAAGTEVKGDMTTLEDFGIIERLSSNDQ